MARGAHLVAMRENGLRIEGDRGETHIQPTQATANIADIGVVDYVLLCVICSNGEPRNCRCGYAAVRRGTLRLWHPATKTETIRVGVCSHRPGRLFPHAMRHHARARGRHATVENY